MGAVASALRQRSVSHPRSSNRTCRSPASGSPTGFTVRPTERRGPLQAMSARQLSLLRLAAQLSLKGSDHSRCCQAHRQSPSPRHLRKHTRSQGPFLRRHYPASTVVLPRSCSLPQMAGGSASGLSLSRPARASHNPRRVCQLSAQRSLIIVWSPSQTRDGLVAAKVSNFARWARTGADYCGGV